MCGDKRREDKTCDDDGPELGSLTKKLFTRLGKCLIVDFLYEAS